MLKSSHVRPWLAAVRQATRSDQGGIVSRIRSGQVLLDDPTMTTPAGHLRHGVTEMLVRAASAQGLKRSATELRYELRAALTYRTEAEISRVAADVGTWTALVEAGFPRVEVDPEEAQPALVTPDGAGVEPTALPVQPPLDGFPLVLVVGGSIVPLDSAPLSSMGAYCDDGERRTDGHRRADARRRAEYERLLTAAGSDLDMSVGQARALADAGAA